MGSTAKDTTVCEFPCFATGGLPFIHHGFPPNQRKKFGRYLNSLSKDIGLHPEIKLPPLTHTDSSYWKKKTTSQYVSNNKACWRLKGIDPNHVFSVKRNKPGSTCHRDSVTGVKVSTPTSKNGGATDGEMWAFAVESIARATSQGAHSHSTDTETTEVEANDVTRALTERLEGYNKKLGVRPKKAVNGRKLGDVLSTKRLKQLMRDEERTLPYTYYKTQI